jgi:uncharacterized SAM-binding protein YcdF (DUF218 family)
MQRLVRSRVLLASLAVVLALAVVGGWLFVRPVPDPPGRADVLLVLAGGRGEREAAGARLAQAGAAPDLVFSDGGRADSSSGRLCLQRFEGVRVLCLHPESDTTQGEARAFAELARREGWRSVTVVTSSYHRHRAGLLVGRCFAGTVHTVGAAPNRTASVLVVPFAARESVALVAALTVRRDC